MGRAFVIDFTEEEEKEEKEQEETEAEENVLTQCASHRITRFTRLC